MAHFEIEGDRLLLRFSTWERIGGLRKGAEAPLAAVLSVDVAESPWRQVRGMRVGTGLPGVVLLGTMLRGGKNDVIAVYGRKPIVVVTLGEGASHQRWLVTVDEPALEVERLRAALAR